MYKLTTDDRVNNTRRRPGRRRLLLVGALRLPGYGLRVMRTFPHMVLADGVTQRGNWAHHGATPWVREMCEACGDGPVRASWQHQMPLHARTSVLFCGWAEELRGGGIEFLAWRRRAAPR